MTKRQALMRAMADRRGMTLIEIMVVIAIIGILSTAIGFGVVSYLNKAKVDAAEAQVRQVSQTIELYAAENNYPNDLREIVESKLLKEKKLKDPWQEELLYNVGGRGDSDSQFTLCSKGPDRSEGGDDDICND